jgi:uncharacterized protein
MHKAYVSIQTPDFDKCRLLKQFLLLLKNNDFQIRKSSDFYLIQDKNKNFYHNQALIINTNLDLQEFQKVLISMAEFVCKKITDHFEIEIVSFYDHKQKKAVQLSPKHNLEHYISFQEIDPQFLVKNAQVSANKIAPLVEVINRNTVQKLLNITLLILITLLAFNSKFVKAVHIENKSFQVEIADTSEKRRQGLADRSFLHQDNGMLFIYPLDQTPRFWTKNMNFAIDIIFLNQDMQVTKIYENTLPCKSDPCAIYPGSQNTRYVLELNAYQAKNHNIKLGDTLELKTSLTVLNKNVSL